MTNAKAVLTNSNLERSTFKKRHSFFSADANFVHFYRCSLSSVMGDDSGLHNDQAAKLLISMIRLYLIYIRGFNASDLMPRISTFLFLRTFESLGKRYQNPD